MGIIETFKRMFGDKLLEEVIAAHGLTRKYPEHALAGYPSATKVWAGQVDNCPVRIEPVAGCWLVTAGDLGPNDDDEDSIFLERVDPAEMKESDKVEEIDKYLEWSGPAVAEQYLIGGEPESGDYSALKHPAMSRYLPAFSRAVEVVDLFINRKALTIYLRREGLSRSGFDQDLMQAIEFSRAWSK